VSAASRAAYRRFPGQAEAALWAIDTGQFDQAHEEQAVAGPGYAPGALRMGPDGVKYRCAATSWRRRTEYGGSRADGTPRWDPRQKTPFESRAIAKEITCHRALLCAATRCPDGVGRLRGALAQQAARPC
jgi:hypothetical protein